jgi:GNAT superfamily N-acetyltransferase
MHGNCKIIIRSAEMGDAARIAAFNCAMALETERKELASEIALQGVKQALADPSRAAYYLAEVDRQVVGQTMVTLEWSDWRNGFFWWIQSVYVEPRFRRLGVFRALHNHIRAEALSRDDVCGLRLYVHHDNNRAMETYQKLGMDRTEYLLFEEEF